MFERLFRLHHSIDQQKKETTEQIWEQLHQPGNLVWGGSFRKKELADFLARGICPAMITGKPMSFVPHAVCMTMLPINPMAPENYFTTHHRAPKEITRFPQDEIVNLGIIVSPHKLMERFPDAKAIGSVFTVNPHLFGGNPHHAFGIPIIDPHWITGEQGWEMEVRVPFQQGMYIGITPDMWSGIIVGSMREFALPLQQLYTHTFLPNGQQLS